MLPRLIERSELTPKDAGGGPPGLQDPVFSPQPRVQVPLGKVAAHGAAMGPGGRAKGRGRRRGPGG